MKTWIKMLIAVAVMAMMAACHPDEKKDNGQTGGTKLDGPEKSVYLSLNVALPPAGPAAKYDGETNTEAGSAEENMVNTMLVVLADKDDNSIITYGTLANPSTSGANRYGIASMDKNGLTHYYSTHESSPNSGTLADGKDKINVFVFCNYTKELLEQVKHEANTSAAAETGDTKSGGNWLHAIAEVANSADEAIWANGSFLMTNQSMATRAIPQHLVEWNTYVDESKPFKLCGSNAGIDNSDQIEGRGPIMVQRVMARIDLKDGSSAADGGLGNWTYKIDTKGTEDGDLNVRIVRASLVNQSKKFFFLEHVHKAVAGQTSSAGDIANPSKSIVCSTESGDGLSMEYVVDADAGEDYKQKTGDNLITGDLTQAFMYPLFNSDGGIDNQVRQGWKSTSSMEGFKSDKFYPWTYTTENTAPHTSNRAGITTGIVFKGRLEPTDNANQTLRDAANGNYTVPSGEDADFYLTEVDGKKYPLLYAFGEIGRKLYVGWNDQVKAAAGENTGNLISGTIAYAYYTPCYTPQGETEMVSPKEMFDRLLAEQHREGATEEDIRKAREAFKAAAVEAGFTVYQAGMANEDFSDGALGQEGDEAGYYCYYFYWLRHNLAVSVGVVNPMEYAVVRNNVYRLSISRIRRFGHPRFPQHDADPITVNTPCETSEMYLSVEVEVAKWVTRESSIIL